MGAGRPPSGTRLTCSDEYRKLDPGSIEECPFFDHPSGRARIHMAMQRKAAHLDEVRRR